MGAAIDSRAQILQRHSVNTTSGFFRTSQIESAIITNRSFTVELWFKRLNAGKGVLVNEVDQFTVTSWDASWMEVNDSGNLMVGVPGIATGIDLGPVPLNTWTHAAVRYDHQALTLDGFLNGRKAAGTVSGTRRRPVDQSRTAFIAFGRAARDTVSKQTLPAFSGLIDEVRIWSSAVSDNDLLVRHSQRIPGAMSTLASNWHLEEGSGSSSADSSGKANAALFVGAAWVAVDETVGVPTPNLVASGTVANMEKSIFLNGSVVNATAFPGAEFFFEWGSPGATMARTPVAQLPGGVEPANVSATIQVPEYGGYVYRLGLKVGGLEYFSPPKTFAVSGPAQSSLAVSPSQYFRTSKGSSSFKTKNISIEAWIKPSAAGVVFNEVDRVAPAQWDYSLLEVLPSRMVAAAIPGLPTMTFGPIQFDQWIHVALVYDEANKEQVAYLNGLAVGRTTGVPRLTPSSGGRDAFYAFGRGTPTNLGGGAFFTGEFDEVRVWDLALSQSQLSRHRESLIEGDEAGLAAYWRLDMMSGPTGQPPLGSSPDYSRNANPAVLVGLTQDALRISTASVGPILDPGVELARPAIASAQVVNGFVVGISLMDGGRGYEVTPAVRIVGGGGTGATAEATMANGVVTSIRVVSPGSGYTGPVTVQIDPPPFPPRKAVAIAEIVNGFVVGLTVLDGGNGYTEAPAVLVAGGGGNGATATAQLSNGVVTGFTITNPGSGYTGFPVVSIASPPFAPELSIAISRVKVTLKVVLGKRYVIEASQGLGEWVEAVAPFTAQAEVLEQEFMVETVGRFFRVRQVP